MGLVAGLLVFGFFVGCLAVVWFILLMDHDDLKEEKDPEETRELISGEGKSKKKKRKAAVPVKKRAPYKPRVGDDPTLDETPSPLLFREVKGHTAQVTAVGFSPDGRFVATASEDGTVRVVFMNTLKDQSPRYFRLAIERDQVSALAFSDNSKRLVCATFKGREMLFYSIPTMTEVEKGAVPSLLKQFPSGHETMVTDVLLLDVDKWMVVVTATCGSSDTSIRFHNPKGELLSVMDTNQMMNNTVTASPDNRFLAVGASLPEVKVLEVTRSKTGEFQQVSRAMTLAGHKKPVAGVAFNKDATRVVTASADASWRVWDTSVRYNLDEEPRGLEEHISTDLHNNSYSGLALGLNGSVVALSCKRHLFFHAVGIRGEWSGRQVESVGVAHGSKGTNILRMEASKDGKLLVTVAEGDKYVRLWSFPHAD